MLEPYQAAYNAPISPPAPPPRPLGPCINIQSTSDITIDDEDLNEPVAGCSKISMEHRGSDWIGQNPTNLGFGGFGGTLEEPSRSPSMISVRSLNPARRVKSAVDLVSLVMQEQMASKPHFSATNV